MRTICHLLCICLLSLGLATTALAGEPTNPAKTAKKTAATDKKADAPKKADNTKKADAAKPAARAAAKAPAKPAARKAASPAVPAPTPTMKAATPKKKGGVFKGLDIFFGKVVNWIATVFFWKIPGTLEKVPSKISAGAFGKLLKDSGDQDKKVLQSAYKQSRKAYIVRYNLTKKLNNEFAIKQLVKKKLKLIKLPKTLTLKEHKKLSAGLSAADKTTLTAHYKQSKTAVFTDYLLHLNKSNTTALYKLVERRAKEFKGMRNGIPLVVMWLFLGAIFLTFRMGFVNFRLFGHAIKVTAGKYDNPEDEGEVSHFQALTSALSATVGLGNIAGVAIAVSVGGPGATFWMIVVGLLGMSSKFTECTLGQKYRHINEKGEVAGGAMYYLSEGLKAKGLGGLGKVLAVLFAILCIGGSLGGGNSFQVNQSLGVLKSMSPFFGNYPWVYGLVITVLAGIVIIGGITRIAATAEKIVPLMTGIYVAACLFIILGHISHIPAAIGTIISSAFSPSAAYGGLLGVLVMGIKRAAFSNEAGIGSAAIAHAAAKTEYPVREGVVAVLEPFIDTVIVCTMTALVIVITGAYKNPEYASFIAGDNGAALTAAAMGNVISWFPYLLSIAVCLFAFSTMISWSYYGERCWNWLFNGGSLIYKIIFLTFAFLGSVLTSTKILVLSDLMILGMAFPNILGLLILSNMVKGDLDDYTGKLKNGEFDKA